MSAILSRYCITKKKEPRERVKPSEGRKGGQGTEKSHTRVAEEKKDTTDEFLGGSRCATSWWIIATWVNIITKIYDYIAIVRTIDYDNAVNRRRYDEHLGPGFTSVRLLGRVEVWGAAGNACGSFSNPI